MKNCININTKQDNILIKINEEAEQKDIIECLKNKLPQLKKLYQKDDTPIVVTGKVLKNKEIDEIQDIIKECIDVNITFDSPRSLGLHGIKRAYSKQISTSETKFHKGSLRSGQRLEFEGSLVIIGDVNDGAEAVAGENIVILGTLRGLAHAGAKGNKDAIISAVSIEAPQVRIANVIREREKEEITESNVTYAYINKEYEKLILE